jgi:hypothetical protein
MTLIAFPARLHAARAASATSAVGRKSPATTVLAFLRHVGRRLADAPLDSSVLHARPVPRTRARSVARSAAGPRDSVVMARASALLHQQWTPEPARDGKMHLVAHWSTRT